MGNCLRLGISRVGLAWSKWRMSAKFKRKTVSLIILGMQAVGKSTIALRLYKFKRTLPDANYVQTKGFNTFTVKKNKTTVHIYDLGGHASIQELWDHYYADAHGVIFVVDTSKRETVPEAGQLLTKVLSDHRIRGKPVLLLANKIDLDGVSENELDTMLNLQHLVNSVRCLTRLDVSCAIDLINDKGIFEGFKWLVSYIESNYMEINTRVLSDTLEEKNKEKARREAVKAARLQDLEEDAKNNPLNENAQSSSIPESSPVEQVKNEENVVPNGSTPLSPRKNKTSASSTTSRNTNKSMSAKDKALRDSQESLAPAPRPISVTRLPVTESGQSTKIPAPLLPPINTTSSSAFVDHPVKLPKLKSPKSKPEIINRIEDHGDEENLLGTTAGVGNVKGFLNSLALSNQTSSNTNDPYNNNDKGFRRISAARRLSPEGADSDDGIVNVAYEPSEDLSSDSTPIGVRKHNFAAGSLELDYQNREILMVTTLAEVHKEYFKDRKGSTSTHDSVSMSAVSAISEATTATDIMMDDAHQTPMKGGGGVIPIHQEEGKAAAEDVPSQKGKGKTKKRLGLKPKNKTAPLDQSKNNSANGSPAYSGTPIRALPEIPPNKSRIPTSLGHGTSVPGKMPFTVSSAWEGSDTLPEQLKMTSVGGRGNGTDEKKGANNLTERF